MQSDADQQWIAMQLNTHVDNINRVAGRILQLHNEEFPKPRLRAFAGFPLIAEAIRSLHGFSSLHSTEIAPDRRR
jgi:hypothetical protein